jgi:hypothetical protein
MDAFVTVGCSHNRTFTRLDVHSAYQVYCRTSLVNGAHVSLVGTLVGSLLLRLGWQAERGAAALCSSVPCLQVNARCSAVRCPHDIAVRM